MRPMIVVCAVAAVLLAVPAAAGACPNYAMVKSFHGYVLVDFHKTVSGPDGSGGTETVTLDHSTSVIHFRKLAPLYIHGGPPGHTMVVSTEFRGLKATGVMTVEDSHSDSASGMTGTQTADGHPRSRVTLGLTSFGCVYYVVMSFEIATQTSGSWPGYPEGGTLILAASPMRSIPANLTLKGSATVPLVNGETPTTGYFDSWAPDGSWGPWENAFENIVQGTGQPTPTADIQWGFAPNKT